MQMCELSLDETRLASKRGAEILADEFEHEWMRHGGQPLHENNNPTAKSTGANNAYHTNTLIPIKN